VAKAILALLGRADAHGQAYNLAQDETPTLSELLTLVAERLGAPDRLVDVPAARGRAAGLDPLLLSPFSGTWMSFLDPARAKEELGFRHEPLGPYLDKIVTTFLAHPRADPPPGYEHRPAEIRLVADLA
jgi:nucleoside-diphosphate-sugar epimerase